MISRQFFIFLCTGGFAAAVNFGSRIFLSQFMNFSSAIICAYLLGMITAFLLAKLFVFKQSSHSTVKSAFYFTLINCAAVLQTWLVSMGLVTYVLPWINWTSHTEEIAHAIGVMIPVFSSYVGHKYITFR